MIIWCFWNAFPCLKALKGKIDWKDVIDTFLRFDRMTHSSTF